MNSMNRTEEFLAWARAEQTPEHTVTVTRVGGGGCPHAVAPHGCGYEEFACSCGARAHRSLCGNDALGGIRMHEFAKHLPQTRTGDREVA